MLSKITRFIGYFLISLAFLICFKMLNFEIDSLHRSLKNIRFLRLRRSDTTKDEEEDVQESSNEKNPEGYQNAVSTWNFILVLEISYVKRVLINDWCRLYRRNPGVDRKTWLYLVHGVIFLYPVLRVSEVIFQEAVVADTILVCSKTDECLSDESCALY